MLSVDGLDGDDGFVDGLTVVEIDLLGVAAGMQSRRSSRELREPHVSPLRQVSSVGSANVALDGVVCSCDCVKACRPMSTDDKCLSFSVAMRGPHQYS